MKAVRVYFRPTRGGGAAAPARPGLLRRAGAAVGRFFRRGEAGR